MRSRKTNFFIIIISVICVSVLAQWKISSAATFYRNLSQGTSGQDVLQLQKILNSDPITQISTSGAGSSGYETVYFGTKTTNAVIRFQEKYATDVLFPAQLSRGTGYVGHLTIAKLESLSQMKPTVAVSTVMPETSSATTTIPLPSKATSVATQTTPISQSTKTPPVTSLGIISTSNAFVAVSPKDLIIFGLSNLQIKSGDTLTVTGYGFDPDSVVHIGATMATIQIISSSIIKVAMPTMPYGPYDLWVTNSRGSSKMASPFKITIGTVTDSRPEILSVSPNSAGQNSIIKVTANKLDATDNIIYSTLGTIKSIPSSDGKTISFNTNDLPNSSMFFKNNSVNQFAVSFGIRTAAGLSGNYGYFFITK